MLLWGDFIGTTNFEVRPQNFTISGVHFDFLSPKDAELKVK